MISIPELQPAELPHGILSSCQERFQNPDLHLEICGNNCYYPDGYLDQKNLKLSGMCKEHDY
jgi:hypothetical protein